MRITHKHHMAKYCFLMLMLIALHVDAGEDNVFDSISDVEIEKIMIMAEQGDAQAQYALGIIYNNGTNQLQQDKVKAEQWYTKSAEQGFVEAQATLAELYTVGENVPQENYIKAEKWARTAAEKGNGKAQHVLGWLYNGGRGGLVKDEEQARFWLTKAAENGYAESQLMLGVRYITEGNMSLGLQWVAKAALQGDERAIEIIERATGTRAPR